MKPKLDSPGVWAFLAVLLTLTAAAQVTITSSDMFNQVGQNYLAYANNSTNTVAVSSLLGTTGGPQAWDFSTGPTDVTYRFDYLPATNGLNGADFAALGATITERKTDVANTNDVSWLFFAQDPLKGRLDYGFYDPSFSALQPEGVFTNGLQDFPANIHFGDTWQGTTIFSSVYSDEIVGDVPDQLTYTSTDKVDAYGVVILPNLGFLNCLRIHELVEYDIAFDIGSGFQNFATQYILNYYWLCPGHGIVVQITGNSPTDGSVPPDDLPGGAGALVRMFQTNHPQTTNTNSTPTIKDFTCTLSSNAGALLKWTLSPSLKNYTVQYATNLTASPSWTTLQTVTNNYVIDFNAGKPSAPVRLYRVLGD